MANNGYVQLPPDSTGKRIAHVIVLELDYDTGTIAFAVGDTVTGGTSGATGTVVKLGDDNTVASGELYISLDYESAVAFVDGENLVVNGATHALAASTGTTTYTPTISIVDHENPFNGVNVTNNGELTIAAKEGAFGFDAFGQLKVSQEQYLGLYHYEYGINPGLLQADTGSNDTILTSSNYSGIELTTTATSGSFARVQSHMYHPYHAGTPLKWIGSIACGDSGTAGVVRRWGYFEDDDGCFFELSGSQMNVVIRNSSTTGLGSTVETRVSQSAWNVDKCNGAGGEQNISQANLDPGKGFVYFIDLQWLGVGRVRFGIIWNGQRVVCHQFNHSAELDYPYMRAGTMPARIEQVVYNTAAGPTVMRNFSMAVIASAHKDPTHEFIAGAYADLTATVDWTGSYRPIFSVRSKDYIFNKENRSIAIPTFMDLYSSDAPIAFQVVKWPTLTGDTWAVPTLTARGLQGDTTATTASGGYPVITQIVGAGEVYHKEFPQSWDDAFKIHRKDHIADGNCAYTVTAKLLNTNIAPSSSVTLGFNWKEIT